MIGTEYDLVASGDDNGAAATAYNPQGYGIRGAIDIVGEPAYSGSTVQYGTGIGIEAGSSPTDGVSFGRFFAGNGPFYMAGLDLRYSTQNSGANAIWLATNETIGLDTAGTNGAAATTISSNGSTVAIQGALSTTGTVTANGITLGVTPSTATLGTNPPVSGTAYQWTGPGTLQLSCPVTLNPTSSAAASVSLAIGSSSTLGSTMDAFSLPSGATSLAGMTQTEKADVPAGWYYGLTATNATIGACAAVVH